jgi:hypothetical protein
VERCKPRGRHRRRLSMRGCHRPAGEAQLSTATTPPAINRTETTALREIRADVTRDHVLRAVQEYDRLGGVLRRARVRGVAHLPVGLGGQALPPQGHIGHGLRAGHGPAARPGRLRGRQGRRRGGAGGAGLLRGGQELIRGRGRQPSPAQPSPALSPQPSALSAQPSALSPQPSAQPSAQPSPQLSHLPSALCLDASTHPGHSGGVSRFWYLSTPIGCKRYQNRMGAPGVAGYPGWLEERPAVFQHAN